MKRFHRHTGTGTQDDEQVFGLCEHRGLEAAPWSHTQLVRNHHILSFLFIVSSR